MKRSISVIVCTYNRPGTLGKVLDSLQAQKQDDAFQFEVIIVDNDPNGAMKPMVESYQSKFPGWLRYFIQPVRGKANAMNLGVKEARGDILALTDDDVIVDPAWLSNIARCFNEQPCDGIGGRVLPIYPDNTPQWVRNNPHQMAGVVVIYDQGDVSRPVDASVERFIGANWAFKKEVFDDCGLFRVDLGPGMPAMGEDEEFYDRLIKRGKKLYYCAEAVIRHPVDLKRLTLKSTAAWQVCLGRFEALKEIERKQDIALFFGVPRYIFKGMVTDVLMACLSVFSVVRFRQYFRAFFRKWGMFLEYRKARAARIK